jgi:hypothetical protein
MQTDLSGSVSWPAVMTDLDVGERIVIWAFRCWVSADENQPLVRSGLCEHFAPGRAEAALLAFEDFVDAICGAACRTIYYHAPGCPCVGVDEMYVATLVAASQDGDVGGAAAAARYLVHPDGFDRASAAAEVLGDALTRLGLTLPTRLRQPDGRVALGRLRTAMRRVIH